MHISAFFSPSSPKILAPLAGAMVLLLNACTAQAGGAADGSSTTKETGSAAPVAAENVETAIVAGGCFWCTESDFEKVDGVITAVSGYIGGEKVDPTYHEVSSGSTGHTEAVRIEFDATKLSYRELLDIFWHSIDPTVEDRQFCDRGSQYRSGIFYLDDEQESTALASLADLETTKPFSDPIVTEITAADTFYVAEEYHQDFYKKSPGRYYSYRRGCGRDARLAQIWGEKK